MLCCVMLFLPDLSCQQTLNVQRRNTATCAYGPASVVTAFVSEYDKVEDSGACQHGSDFFSTELTSCLSQRRIYY